MRPLDSSVNSNSILLCWGLCFALRKCTGTASLQSAEGRDLLFHHATRKMVMCLLPKHLKILHSSQSCLRLVSAKGSVPAAWRSPPRQMPFAAAPLCPGAPAMCPDCSFLNPLAVMQCVPCILKRGNRCPGTLQGQDKATAEWHFCWKMCFAYNCNRHHLWLLVRTNCLYWWFGICPFCFLGTCCIGQTLLELFFTATVQYSRLLDALLSITGGRKALYWNYL